MIDEQNKTIRIPSASIGGHSLRPNFIYWNEVDKGGQFAAFEQPKIFSEEMRKAFHSVRLD